MQYPIIIGILCLAIVFFCAYYPQMSQKMPMTTKGLYTAIIVEPRQHPALEFVLKNMCSNLSPEWNIVVMHGTQNKEHVEHIVRSSLKDDAYRIKLRDLNVENLTIADYNKLLTSAEFYEKNIPTEIFLIFQTDSMICNSEKIKVEDFFEYDYVGAPLVHMNGFVGNGGFSLRRKSKMLEILEKCPYNGGDPEDIYFANGCQDAPVNKPSREIAATFSNEGEITEYSFGTHKPWGWGVQSQKGKTCKGLDELTKLNV